MVGDTTGALCYHSLFGNLFFLNEEYASYLIRLRNSEIEIGTQPSKDQEFIDAWYLVDNDTAERDRIAMRNKAWLEALVRGDHLRLLSLMISEACNFGCKHCLHSCSIETSGTHGQNRIMSWEIAKKAIDAYSRHLFDHGMEHLDVHFGSAEPLMNPSVLRLSVEHIRAIDPTATLALNTNLSLLDDEMAVFLRDNGVSLSISLDGPPEGNDAIRTYRDGSGTFHDIVDKMDLCDRLGLPLDGFSITINDLNFDSVTEEFIEWAHQRGIRGIATDIDMINVINARRSVDQCVKKLMTLRATCLSFNIESFGSWTTAYDGLVNGYEDNMPAFCRAVKGRNISVNPDGTMFVCGHTSTVVGKIDRLADIYSPESTYTQLVDSRLPGNDPICRGCSIEGHCAGQCQITREVSSATGNSRFSDLCQFYQLATRELLCEKLAREKLKSAP